MNHFSIWKFVLEATESQEVEMPVGSEIISAESQGDSVVIYALVKPKEEGKEVYKFLVYGTGHDIRLNITEYRFLDTVKMYSGSLMFHVFYKRNG